MLEHLIIPIYAFLLIAISAWQIGELFSRIKLPKITGYLFTGIIAGPFVLGLLTESTVHDLLFIDEVSLAVIAFAAGSELYLPELRGKFKSIGWITASLVLTTLTLGTIAIYFLAGSIPFLAGMSPIQKVAVGLLTSSILVARSPSSAIAIINELRAKGAFTQIVLGVTVIMDVVVIIVFAISSSVADAVLTQVSLNLSFLLVLLLDLGLAAVEAFLVYLLLDAVLKLDIQRYLKSVIILIIGYSVFIGSTGLREYTHDNFPFELLVEPLLVCMVASFLVNNRSVRRKEYSQILHDIGPFIYIAFFTITGSSLELDILAQTWQIAVALYFVRMVSIMIGSFTGGTIAGNPPQHNRLRWMGFITQAGVALGLAKEVAVEFPELGNAFATMIISVVVLNELTGPLFFKWVINRVGEARTRAQTAAFDGIRDAVIFGLGAQSVALARQLRKHNWQVTIAAHAHEIKDANILDNEIPLKQIETISAQTLKDLKMEKAEALIGMWSDEENLALCEIAYENFGTKEMVVHMHDRSFAEKFHELGAKIVHWETATLSLLEHFVRSPSATSLLLGEDSDHEIVEIEMRNRNLHHVSIRDLQLPLDTLVMSIRRNQQTLMTYGYTKLEYGDSVTMLGSPIGLEEVILRFEG
jgi:Trk K+ transport system NAD-binding subunit/Kef-type K+ transport system membrane component KefB